MYCTALRIATLSLVFTILAKGQGGLQVTNIPLGSYFIKGEPYNITYDPADNNSTLVVLVRGPPEAFADVATLSTDAVGGRLAWAPGESLTPDDNYGIRISRDDHRAWSSHFAIKDKVSVFSSASKVPPPASSGVTFSSLPNSSPTGEIRTTTSNAGLSIRTLAGIAVGVAIAGLNLAGGAFFIGWIFRRKSRPVKAVAESWVIGSKPELDSKSIYRYEAPREMDATMEVRELHSDAVVGEVDASNTSRDRSAPQELHGNSFQVKDNQ